MPFLMPFYILYINEAGGGGGGGGGGGEAQLKTTKRNIPDFRIENLRIERYKIKI